VFPPNRLKISVRRLSAHNVLRLYFHVLNKNVKFNAFPSHLNFFLSSIDQVTSQTLNVYWKGAWRTHVHFHHPVQLIILIFNLINCMVSRVVVWGPHTISCDLSLLWYDGHYPRYFAQLILQTQRSHNVEQINDLSAFIKLYRNDLVPSQLSFFCWYGMT
jgi:hypothetical protein